ncbi:MAG: RNA-guided endonuclease InsQ/TnpB family protein [Candidatus Kariarchaeaceae archaeon]
MKTSKNLSELCHLSKNLYNEGNYYIRQELFKNDKWIQYNSLYHLLKSSENYQKLPAQSAQQILKILNRSWKSFFRGIKIWKKGESGFPGKPRLPKYKSKNAEFILVFTNQQVKIRNNVLILPRKVGFEVKTRLPDTVDIREVRILPKGVGYLLEVVYKKQIHPKLQTKTNILAIDLGVRNLITAVNNNGLKPFVIKGGVTKSINQYYNKEKARIQSTYNRQGIKTGKKLERLIDKRNKKLYDYFHKASRVVIDYCLTNDFGTIVIGYNPKWKHKCKIGKRNTQNFVTIPYLKLVQQIEYKAEEQGITIVKQEESYSSKCSFLDCEILSHHDNYIGKRICRGLFQSRKGIIINADVNGGYNILRKAVLNAFNADRIEDVGLHPSRLRLVSATS